MRHEHRTERRRAHRAPTGQPTEEELRAAYEAEIKKIRVEQVLLEHVVSLVNLGMRRTGLAPGTEDERDLDQVRLAIEAVRALLPLIEQAAPAQAGADPRRALPAAAGVRALGGAGGPRRARRRARPAPERPAPRTRRRRRPAPPGARGGPPAEEPEPARRPGAAQRPALGAGPVEPAIQGRGTVP